MIISEIIVLFNGYSSLSGENQMNANCSCTLIKGVHNIIVDTMTAWDSERIKTDHLYNHYIDSMSYPTAGHGPIPFALEKYNVAPDKINYVISTHGHSDHIGNNNLFLKAKHIVGFSISFQETYYIHPFEKGVEYNINNSVKVIPTPGHTLSDVTVLATNTEVETVAIAGDLFERFEDIENPNIWLEAGSEDPVQQMKNRSKVADLADWIVPGHGPKFQITEDIRESLKRQAGQESQDSS